MGGWIGTDFDGTLAQDNVGTWPFPGPPVPLMLQRVKNWLAQGIEVRIVTARVSDPTSRRKHLPFIEEWCREHLGQVIPVTNGKDFSMMELWDDRTVQVIPNTGLRADGKDDPSENI